MNSDDDDVDDCENRMKLWELKLCRISILYSSRLVYYIDHYCTVNLLHTVFKDLLYKVLGF